MGRRQLCGLGVESGCCLWWGTSRLRIVVLICTYAAKFDCMQILLYHILRQEKPSQESDWSTTASISLMYSQKRKTPPLPLFRRKARVATMRSLLLSLLKSCIRGICHSYPSQLNCNHHSVVDKKSRKESILQLELCIPPGLYK